MVDFTASNGAEVRKLSGGSLNLDHPEWNQYRLYPGHVEALREFFLAERDEELGRWRWPEYPEWVVYKEVNSLGYHVVLNEKTSYKVGISRDDVEGVTDTSYCMAAAKAFFAAHPEPKPWRDAGPNEVWLFKSKHDDTPVPFTRHPSHSRWVNPAGWELGERYMKTQPFGEDHDSLFTPRRIWPEAEED